MKLVAADWLRSDKREDDLGGRPGSIVQVGFRLSDFGLYYNYNNEIYNVI